MNLHVDIQTACSDPVPDEDDIRRWIQTALQGRQQDSEISLRLVSEPEMTELNRHYRGKSGSTNVLSFPADLPEGLDLPLLGDIVICAAVVEREAKAQHKPTQAHWAHMTIHGILHLLGYDHITTTEAEQMETLETQLLDTLGIPCPYTSPIFDDDRATERTSL